MKKNTLFLLVAAIILIIFMIFGRTPKESNPTSLNTNETPENISPSETDPKITPTNGNQIAITKIQVGEKVTQATPLYPAKAFSSTVQTKAENGFLVVQNGDQEYILPLWPRKTQTNRPLLEKTFGISVNGELIAFGEPMYWNNDETSEWMYLPTTQTPQELLQKLSKTEHSPIIGYAADGFPIYGPYGFVDEANIFSGIKKLRSSYHLKEGNRDGEPKGTYDGTYVQDYEFIQGLGALDECNGRYGPTPEYPAGIYYYVLTDTFPMIPRCHVGSVAPN